MAKIGIVGDIHFGANENSEVFTEYQNQSIDWMYNNMRNRGISNIFFLGDIFDKRKHIVFKTLETVQKTFNRTDEFNHIIIAGNHDCYSKSNNDITSIRLLLPNMTVIDDLPETVNIDGKSFLCVPWINKTNIDQVKEIIENSKADILFGHLDLVGFEMIRGIKSEKGHISLNILSNFDHVYSGHYHCFSSKNNITYIGSLVQLTWNDHGEDKFIGIYDTETDEIEYIANPYSIYEKIFIDGKEKLPSPDDMKGKLVKIFIYIERDIETERYINSIIDVAANVNIIDERTLRESTVDCKQIKGMMIHEVWNEYLNADKSLSDSEKQLINKLFNDTYTEVMMGEEE